MISILNSSCHFIEKGIAHYKCDPFFKFTYLLTLPFCRKPYTNLDSLYKPCLLMIPALCQLTEDDEQGGLRFEIDKHRIGLRLTAPYSSERRAAASQKAKEQQNW